MLNGAATTLAVFVEQMFISYSTNVEVYLDCFPSSNMRLVLGSNSIYFNDLINEPMSIEKHQEDIMRWITQSSISVKSIHDMYEHRNVTRRAIEINWKHK